MFGSDGGWSSRQVARWRRLGGGLLAGLGVSLIALTVLAGTGVVPLWQPAVPRPPALVEAEATRAAADPRASVLATGTPTVVRPVPVAAAPAAVPAEAPTAADPEPAPADLAPEPASAPPSPEATATPAPPTATPTPTPFPTPVRAVVPTVPPPPTRVALPTATPPPTAVPVPPAPGLPVHLVIPRIRVDTPVVELSTTLDARGVPQWETVPFVAGHYRVTGLAGAPTNVVLSGHVLTRGLGNVFRDLHLLRPGDPIVVYTEGGEFTYRVTELRLVPPADVSALAPSREPRLTLITCAGVYDFRAQSFTERLIVVGDLVTT